MYFLDNEPGNSIYKPYDPSQEPIFPPELTLRSKQLSKQTLIFRKNDMTWFRPTSLEELLTLKNKYPEAKLVVGNTELGIEMKFKKMAYPVMIQPNKVAELNDISITDEGICVGASVTLSSMEQVLMDHVGTFKGRVFEQIIQMLRWFAGKQIRNVGSVGGNIITGSPISDLNPIFMAANCELTLASKDKQRRVRFDQNFYTGYRKSVLEPHEVLVNITIPFTKENEHFVAFKQARRRDDDIAIVNGAFFYSLSNDKVISEARMAFGGLSFVTKMALKAGQYLAGKTWNQSTFEEALEILLAEFPLPPGVPGAMVRYRQTLAMSLFFKSYLSLSESSSLDPRDLSAQQVFHKDPLRGSQLFEIVPEAQDDHDPLRRPLKHASAEKQTTGEAVYIDDIPRMKDELYLAFVNSQKAHAKLVNIDASEAMKMDGVVAFYSHKDIDPKQNFYCMILERDEWLFAQDKVECIGQIIGIIVAKTQDLATMAADKVKITYEEMTPIVTMDDAIAKKSFHPMVGPRIKAANDIQDDLSRTDRILEGEFRSGAQEHFYMETQSCLAVPSREDGELIIYASTQNPTETQRLVAHVLNLPMNRIAVKVKRLGGGFGGKETRSVPITMATAFAATKTNLPVRVSLDRDQDMLMCGHRHPFYTKYKVGISSDGLLKALDTDIYNNAGYSLDLSFSVMHR